jgi:hypothetical protein
MHGETWDMNSQQNTKRKTYVRLMAGDFRLRLQLKLLPSSQKVEGDRREMSKDHQQKSQGELSIRDVVFDIHQPKNVKGMR